MAGNLEADINNRVKLRPVDATPIDAPDVTAGARSIANAVGDVGRAVGQVAEDQQRINDIYDEAAVARADTAAMTSLAEARAAALAATGFDAQEAQAGFRTRAEGLGRDLATSLANPRQRRMFTDMYARRMAGDMAAVSQHATSQVREARIGQANARITAARDRMVDFYSDPTEVQTGLATIEAEVRVALAGAGEEAITAEIGKQRSGFRVAVVQRMLAGSNGQQPDPLAALRYMDEHAGEISPEQETVLRRQAQPQIDDAVVDAAEAEVLIAAGLRAPTPNPGTPPPAGEPGVRNTPVTGVQPVDVPASTPAAEPVAPAQRDPLRGRGAGNASSRFGEARGEDTHNGVDLPAAEGTPVYAPAPGRVIASWFDTEHGGGNSVIVEHPDGRRTGYAHLRNRNVEVGQQVTLDTALGGVGTTGRSTGPHLHYTVRDAQGNHVDPTAQTWGGEPAAGGTSNLVVPTGRKADRAEMYQTALRVAQTRGLNQDQLDDLVSRIDARMGANEATLRAAQGEAEDRVWSAIDAAEESGGLPPSISNLPDFSSLSADAQHRVRRHIMQARDSASRGGGGGGGGGRGGASGSDAYFSLYDMASDPRRQAEFARVDLNQYRPLITRGEYNRLRREQIEMNNGGNGPGRSPRAVSLTRISQAVNRIAPSVGIRTGNSSAARSAENVARRGWIEDSVRNHVARWQEAHPGQDVPDTEIEFAARAATRWVFADTDGDGRREAVRRYDFRVGRDRLGDIGEANIPAADRTEIIRAFRGRFGRAPTTAEIAQFYIRARHSLPIR